MGPIHNCWRDLLSGQVDILRLGGDEGTGRSHTSGLILPGAFNPLHAGHRRMAEIAARRVGRPVEYELSIVNVDKRPLDEREIARRVAQFDETTCVWLTRSATFVEKSAMFPGTTFLVGTDTMLRIADPGYSGGVEAMRDLAIQTIARQGCRFLVFGRLVSGRFCTLADLDLPATLRSMCEAVGGNEFRLDVSSTQLRYGNRSGSE